LSKKFNPTQQKYSAYDRELLAAYEAVKYYHHMLEARHFIIRDDKPITYAFQWPVRPFNHVDFVAQFICDTSEDRITLLAWNGIWIEK
jgi:peroxiredoxin